MPPSTAISRLERRLTDALHPVELRIDDDSAQHVGHPGATNGGHYRVYVVAEVFTGRSLIARHRMIYEAVAENLRTEVHALSIVAKAPAEVPPPAPAASGADDDEETAEDGDAETTTKASAKPKAHRNANKPRGR
ncbi:MAG TPA: BolA family protein [Nevskiaceae bacterium]|nr:BolA family protein [Nevskiaceae bacterium]